MHLPNWLNPQLPLKRWPYLLCGLALFALKYNLDRLICYAAFDSTWYLWDYFNYLDLPTASSPRDPALAWTLALTALPFIIVGTLLTLRRLLDAGLPRWMVSLFFFPLINLALFGLLAIIPSSKTGVPQKAGVPQDETHRRNWLDQVMPVGEKGNAVLAVAVTAVLAIFATWFSIKIAGDYGWNLFIGIPFMQGLAAALLYGYRKPKSLRQCLSVTFISVMFLGLLILILAFEGLLCILMALPIALPLALLGAFMGYHIQRRTSNGVPAAILVFAILPLGGWIESHGHQQPQLVPVTTTIIIDRPKQEVWNQLVAFNDMHEPKEWLFRTGIAFPIRAIIEGKGVGSIRRCQFSTGDFVEPITVWNEPSLLRFSVQKMPPPLVEWSFYNDLQLPHLENYFVSEKGQFKLTTLANGQTVLEGTTWYRHRIWPRVYWRLWSDYILHAIHLRVLNHIKHEAETHQISKTKIH